MKTPAAPEDIAGSDDGAGRPAGSGRARGGRAPTIGDVAAAAGVSPMTVSRVINGEANVRPATRDAVTAAVAALRYAPNPAARSLAGAGALRIGLLYANPSAGFLSELLLGSLEQAALRHAQLVVERCDAEDQGLDAARRAVAGGVAGVLLPPPLCEDGAVLRFLDGARVPAVALATTQAPAGTAAVGIDDRLAALEMTRHLLGLGHRRIGFVTGAPDLSASARRYDGYRAGLAEAGVVHDEALVAPGLYSYRSGLDAAERLLALDRPPTAVFASNDDMAAAAVAAAHRRGLDVPGDLTVVGFDDTALATAIWPELTTVRQPIADMARAAIDRLVAVIRRSDRGEAPPPAQLLAHTLVRRQSDAAPRQRPRG